MPTAIVPWCDRPELARSLHHNVPVFDALGVRTLVVKCGGSHRELRRLVAPFPTVDVLALRGVRFNKALALNAGVHASRDDLVILLDADVLIGSDLVARACATARRGCVVTVRKIIESTSAPVRRGALDTVSWTMTVRARDGRVVRLETNCLRFRDHSRRGPGLAFVSRRDFVRVGGLNSTLHGWGFEDLDLLIRLQLRLGVRHRALGEAIHLSHGDDVRDLRGRARAASERANIAACLAAYHAGHYTGTYHADAAVPKTLERARPRARSRSGAV